MKTDNIQDNNTNDVNIQDIKKKIKCFKLIV